MTKKRKPGRPEGTTIDPSNRYVPLSVRIPQYILDRLDNVSLAKKLSRSEATLQAISHYLFKNQQFWINR